MSDPLFQFRVDATDKGTPPQKSKRPAKVTITVIRNKQTPRFGNLPATISLNMSTAIGTRVFKVEGRDTDTRKPFNELSFFIVGDDNAPQYFKIDSNGEIKVRNSLRSAPGDETQYKVRVQVQDGGTPPHDAAAILTINMLRNLRAPTFDSSRYSATILETKPIGQSILKVAARDGDEKPPHNQVTYQLTNEHFTVDDAGIISLKRSLLGETAESYSVRISHLLDHELNHASIHLLVGETRTLTQLTIVWIPIFLVVFPGNFKIKCVNMCYSIYLFSPIFQLNLYAIDKGVPPQRTGPNVVTVKVIRNKNSPKFSTRDYKRTIRQDVSPGTSVVSVVARDTDTRVNIG